MPLTAANGPWYRAVADAHLIGPPPGAPPGSGVQPLWPGGAARKGARFTPRATVSAHPFDCLYLAEDELTSILEISGVLRPPGSSVRLVFEPQVMMTVDGVLTDVLDLVDSGVQAALGTTHQELTGAWLVQQSEHLAGLGPLPPTQMLGREALASRRVVAMRYPSAKNPKGVGLVVFTGRLMRGRHALRVFNAITGRLQQSLP